MKYNHHKKIMQSIFNNKFKNYNNFIKNKKMMMNNYDINI